MAINRVGYVAACMSARYGAEINKDYTLNDTATAVVAWNPVKGVAPSSEQIEEFVLAAFKKDLIARVNLLSGHVRASYLSDGEYVIEEYRLAEDEARDYINRAYSYPVPETVSDYAKILNTSDYAAVALGIVNTAGRLRTLLVAIRRIRLDCTEKVKAASTFEAAQAIFDVAEASLNQLKHPA